MLRRSVKIQLVLFVIISLAGIFYVGANYAGLNTLFQSGGCTVKADFSDSGGIYTGAEVTYRGVQVGTVGTLNLIETSNAQGVQVDLKLDKCSSPRIPSNVAAVVSDRSAVGEQYVNLVPPPSETADYSGPWLANGIELPMSANSIPVPTQELLTNLDILATSINTDDLTTVLTELTAALNNQGTNLQRLLDAGNALLTQALQPQNVDAVFGGDGKTGLIQLADTVLRTQIAEGNNLQSWSTSLDELSQQLKASDGDIRSLLTTGPSDLQTINSFVNANTGDIGALLSNLNTTGQVVTAHMGGIEEILELYPAIVAGGKTVATNSSGAFDGNAHFGLVTNINQPQDCEQGYNPGFYGYVGSAPGRLPQNTAPHAADTAAHCNPPAGSGSDIRGAQNVPGGDPISTAGGNIVLPRALTANTIAVGDMFAIGGSDGQVTGTGSWLTLLTDGLH